MDELILYICEFCESIPSDFFQQIGSFSLSVFGIGITLFTVIYSFITNKKDLMNDIEPKILNGNACPEMKSLYIIAEKYVNRQKKMNKHILNISLLSITIYLLFLLNLFWDNPLIILLLLLSTIILFIYILISFYLFLKFYFNIIR